MKKNIIKKVAKMSYSGDLLDKDKVIKISKSLKRENLKAYIKTLKNMEAKKTVVVTLSSEERIKGLKDYFSKLYPDKRIIIQIDESLLAGIRVVDFDNVYELSLKDLLENSIKGVRND